MQNMSGFILVFVIFILFPVLSFSEQRIFYISTEEIFWDYAPSGKNLVSDDQSIASLYLEHSLDNKTVGHVYKKIIYKEFTDIHFNQTKPQPNNHGFIGPILTAEVGDQLVVYFKNNATKVLTIHPHGITYDKTNEGSVYDGQIGVSPGTVHRYTWNVTEESGPPMGTGCVSHLYHSDAQYINDVNAGLFGFIKICGKGETDNKVPDDKGAPINNDIFLFVGITDENENPVSNTSDSDEKSNLMHSINGYLYGNVPNLTMCVGATTRLHVGSLTHSKDVHGVKLQGHTFTHRGRRYDAIPVYSGLSMTMEVTPGEEGIWLLSSTSRRHVEAGMQALVTVKECGKTKPIIRADGEIREFYIAAEEVFWKGKSRVMFTGYSDRTFKERTPRDASSSYLGAIGPLVSAEVGDVLKIVFHNKLNISQTIILTGLRTSKLYEGVFYNDGIVDKVTTGPGEKRTYFWFVPEYMGPDTEDDDCIHKVYGLDYKDEQTARGPILVCRRNQLMNRKNRLTGNKDIFLYLMENSKGEIDINGYIGSEKFPQIPTCIGEAYRVHILSSTTHPQTLLNQADPFLVDGSVMSTVGVIPNVPVTVTIVTATEGHFEISNFPQNTVKAAFNTTSCGLNNPDEIFTNSTGANYLLVTKNRWRYVRNSRQWKEQQTGDDGDLMSSTYEKIFVLSVYSDFRRRHTRIPSQGNIGHSFFTTVGEAISVAYKIDDPVPSAMNFSMFSPGLLTELNHDTPASLVWKVPKRVGPGPNDPECISKTYFSSVTPEKDIASGLIGPVIVCNKTVDSKQHTILFLGEVDETKNWFFDYTLESINKMVPRTEMSMDFINNNKINMVNGFSDGTIRDLTLGSGTQYIHLFNVGSKFESIHVPGIGITKTQSMYINNDVVGLHPGTSVSIKVLQTATGKWRLGSLGTDRHWNILQAFINVPETSTGAS